jgi:3-oxoadipate enol-lactonase
MKEITFNNLHIYDYEGTGTPLILIHAFPLNSEMWKPQIDFLKSKFRIITYDIRGLGKSKSVNNQFTMEKYANDLISIVEYFKLDKVFACGLSMGGYILLRSYIKSPRIFRGLILADTRAEKDDDTALINRSNIIENIKNGKREEFISSFLPKLISKNNYKEELKYFLESMIKENSDEGICGAQLAIATRINSAEYLNTFNVPVLIIVGEDDELTPVSCSKKMIELFPNSNLKIIKNSGHMSNLENTEAFNNYLIEFIDSNK